MVGTLEQLRVLIGPEEAAFSFVRNAVLPVALLPHVTPAQRRAFLREMHALPFTSPFSGSAKRLGHFPEAAELMQPASYLLSSSHD